MQLSNDFGASQPESSAINRENTAMASPRMKSYQDTLFGATTASTTQLRVTSAPRTPFSGALTSFLTPRIRPLAKTIFVPLTLFLFFTNLIVPVAAMDNQIALAPYPVQNAYSGFTANPPPGFPIRIPLASIGTMAFFTVGYMVTMASQMLGPLMGVTSVLWFIMRNDAAVQPSFSWAYVSTVLSLLGFIDFRGQYLWHLVHRNDDVPSLSNTSSEA